MCTTHFSCGNKCTGLIAGGRSRSPGGAVSHTTQGLNFLSEIWNVLNSKTQLAPRVFRKRLGICVVPILLSRVRSVTAGNGLVSPLSEVDSPSPLLTLLWGAFLVYPDITLFGKWTFPVESQSPAQWPPLMGTSWETAADPGLLLLRTQPWFGHFSAV